MRARKVEPATPRPTDGAAGLVAEYETRTARSRAFHKRLARSLAGGETRAVTFYEPYPFAVAAAEGARVVDVDGNEHLDVNNNMAALIHGHRFPPIVRAFEEAAGQLGTVQAGPHQYQLEFAELLVERFPAFERVRFTNSGSEAAILALRIARRVTGRRRLMMFEGAYHGMGAEFSDDWADTIRVPFNDLPSAVAAIDETVAAVFAESFLGHAGVIPAEPGFLEGIAHAARRRGALFVLDEVQSMRNHFHAWHGAIGLTPDMVLMGKGLCGGLPIGLLGGRRDLIELASVARPDGLGHSGTFNGNVITCAAGVASMGSLDARVIGLLNARAERLVARLEAAGRRAGLPLVVTRSGSTMCLHFQDELPHGAADASSRPGLARSVHIAGLLEGVCLIPGGRLNLSTALTDEDVNVVGESLTRALDRLAAIRGHER